LTQFQNAEKSSLFVKVPHTTVGDQGAVCSGPGSTQIILRNWKINFRTSKYAVGCWGKRLFGRVSLKILSIGTHTWTSRQTGSYRNWTAMVLKSCTKRRTVHHHTMHSLTGSTLVRFSGNVGIVVGHQSTGQSTSTTDHLSTPRPVAV